MGAPMDGLVRMDGGWVPLAPGSTSCQVARGAQPPSTQTGPLPRPSSRSCSTS